MAHCLNLNLQKRSTESWRQSLNHWSTNFLVEGFWNDEGKDKTRSDWLNEEKCLCYTSGICLTQSAKQR